MPISLYFSSRFPLFSIEEKEKEAVEEEEVKKKEEARKKRRGSFQKELSLVVEIRSAMYSKWNSAWALCVRLSVLSVSFVCQPMSVCFSSCLSASVCDCS